jgi:hypothetical protein
MMDQRSRTSVIAGLVAALLLPIVGGFLAVFGDAAAVTRFIEFPLNVIVVALVALHALPFAMFVLVTNWRDGTPKWLGTFMLVLAPFVASRGIYGLFLLGDWGDGLLWGPYLLTGLFMATTGLLITYRRA